jgi:hypothetical protein
MIELKRLVLNFRAEELVVRVLYRTKAGPNPGTVARRWEAADPARSGHLMWGRSPYTLQVASYEPNRRGGAPGLATMEGNMTDHSNERDRERRNRKKTEESDERRREERDRRSDDLQEAWRRNHPSEQEEERKDRPKRGRQA